MASFCAAHSHSHHPAGLEATRGSLAPSQGARLSGNGERRRGNGLRLPLTMREEGERPALDTSAATKGPNDGDQERTLDANLSYCRRFWYDNGLEDEDRIDCAGGEHGVRAGGGGERGGRAVLRAGEIQCADARGQFHGGGVAGVDPLSP